MTLNDSASDILDDRRGASWASASASAAVIDMLKVAAKYFAIFKRYTSAASCFDLCSSRFGEMLPVWRLDAKPQFG
jgi:hypothetical protein